MENLARWMIGVSAAALLACTSGEAKETTKEPAANDAAAAAAIDAALAGAHRSDANKARDKYRHPKETLMFFGLRPDMTVVELWPGTGGWYTEVLAPVLKDKGTYYAAHVEMKPDGTAPNSLKTYKEKLAANPDLYGKIIVTEHGPKGGDVAPPGSADMVLTFRNIHNWMGNDWASKSFETAFRALKPGGILGVVEHRGNPAVPQDPKAKSGYVNEDYAIQMIEAAGFKLVGKSEVNANPKDTKDYPDGVWTLPPTYQLKDKDKEKYTAIGESDRFTLKFQKPKS
jgi:predicted methyltransferase